MESKRNNQRLEYYIEKFEEVCQETLDLDNTWISQETMDLDNTWIRTLWQEEKERLENNFKYKVLKAALSANNCTLTWSQRGISTQFGILYEWKIERNRNEKM